MVDAGAFLGPDTRALKRFLTPERRELVAGVVKIAMKKRDLYGYEQINIHFTTPRLLDGFQRQSHSGNHNQESSIRLDGWLLPTVSSAT